MDYTFDQNNTPYKVIINDEEATPEDFVSVENLVSQCQASTNGKFSCINLSDSVDDTKNRIHAFINDRYGNDLAAIGYNDKVQSFTNYGFSNDTLNWTLWLALYNDSWVFRRAIDKPAQDEIACGFTLHGDEDYSKVYKAYDRYRSDLTQLLMWGALFGGSVAVMMFEGLENEDYSKPMVQKNIVGKRLRLYVTDRWYGCQASSRLVTSMKNIDFGKPTSYMITMANGKQMKIHHSFILRYEHRTAPRLIKTGQLQGWGYAEGSHILNELSRDDQLKSSITSLVNKSLIEIIKMSGMRGVFMGTDKGNMKQLQKRLEMVNWGRTYNSLTFLDKDDEYSQYQMTSLSGLSELLEKNMWMISAALEMQGILYGDLKGGLSQESDALHRYAITIKNRCEAYVRPVLAKFLKTLFIVYDIKGTPDFEFNPLDRDDSNKAKVSAIKELSSMLNDLKSNKIISAYQYAMSIKDYMNNDAINLIISDEHLEKLKMEEEQDIIDSIVQLSKKRNLDIEIPTFGRTSNRNAVEANASAATQEQEKEESPSNDIGENINEEQTSSESTAEAAGEEKQEGQE